MRSLDHSAEPHPDNTAEPGVRDWKSTGRCYCIEEGKDVLVGLERATRTAELKAPVMENRIGLVAAWYCCLSPDISQFALCDDKCALMMMEMLCAK